MCGGTEASRASIALVLQPRSKLAQICVPEVPVGAPRVCAPALNQTGLLPAEDRFRGHAEERRGTCDAMPGATRRLEGGQTELPANAREAVPELRLQPSPHARPSPSGRQRLEELAKPIVLSDEPAESLRVKAILPMDRRAAMRRQDGGNRSTNVRRGRV